MRENTLFQLLGMIRVASKECMTSLWSLLFKWGSLGVFTVEGPYPPRVYGRKLMEMVYFCVPRSHASQGRVLGLNQRLWK